VGDSTLPPSRWNASQSFKGFEVQHWKDLSPRAGIAYDLFGDGKTALKASIARYVQPEATGTAGSAGPQGTIGRTATPPFCRARRSIRWIAPKRSSVTSGHRTAPT
jgi:hypothetical protein